MSDRAPSDRKTFSVCSLLEAWRKRLQHLSADDAGLKEDHQAHLRQALLLTARQHCEPEGLWHLIQAAHVYFMHTGWVHTWACTLQKVVDLWPQWARRYPMVMEHLAEAWGAAGQWSRTQEALQRLRATVQDTPPNATVLLQQAALLWNQGRWEAAYRVAQQAWNRLSPESDALMRVKTARLLLLASWRLHRLRQARWWGQQALAACPQDQVKHLGLIHHFLFLVAWAEQRPEAEHHLTQALRCLRAAGDRLNLANVLADGTELWLAQGRLERAEEALSRSYALWREMEVPAGLADYYRHAARVTWHLGKPALARAYADYALHLWRRLGHPGEIRRCARLLAHLSAQAR